MLQHVVTFDAAWQVLLLVTAFLTYSEVCGGLGRGLE